MVHLKDGVEIEGASQELSEGQRLDMSVGSDLDKRAQFTRVLDFMGHILLVAASGMDSGNGVLEKARRLLGATGDVVVILDTMKSLVAGADLRGFAQRKLESEPNIGGAEEAALLAGAPYKGGSAAGAVSVPPQTDGRPRTRRPFHVHPPRVLGGGQELLRTQATVRDGGGAGSAGSGGRGVRSGGASPGTGDSCGQGDGGDDPLSRFSFGSG